MITSYCTVLLLRGYKLLHCYLHGYKLLHGLLQRFTPRRCNSHANIAQRNARERVLTLRNLGLNGRSVESSDSVRRRSERVRAGLLHACYAAV